MAETDKGEGTSSSSCQSYVCSDACCGLMMPHVIANGRMIRRKERMPTKHVCEFSPGLCCLLSRAFRHECSMGQHQRTSRRACGALVGARQAIWEGQLGYHHCHPPVPAARLGPLADTFRLCQVSLPLLLDHAQPTTSGIWNLES